MTYRPVFQGVTDAQKSIVEYWKNFRDADGRMRRSAINAGHLRSQLANISIVQVEDEGEAVFRLAGSNLRELLGLDARGRCLTDAMNNYADGYALTIAAALDAGRPVGGVVELNGNLISWLRIPLVGKCGRFSQVLCHDAHLPNERYVLDTACITRNVTVARQSVAA